MKKHLIHKIAVVALAFIVMFGSIGLTFSTHFCRTNASLERSFLPFPIGCEHAEMQACDMNNSTSEKSDSCCVSNSTTKVKDEECCKDETKYFRFLSDVNLPQLKIKVVFNQFLAFVIQVFDLLSNESNNKNTSSINKIEEPPPIFGKELAITHHQLKIDPFLL